LSGRREVAIGLGCYGAYLAVRRAVWTKRGRDRALHNARSVVEVERRMGVAAEPAVQSFTSRAPRVVDALNVGYAAANVALSVGWLWWLHRSGDDSFRRERRAAVIAFAGALPVFLAYPTAPPRKLDGFVDTLAVRGIDLEHPFLVRFYNPIAAMPSHHMAFAVVTGAGLAKRARGPLPRAAARGYAPAVALIVIATGNHYVVDVVAGAALGLLARRLAR
jgi:hypothetical protein